MDKTHPASRSKATHTMSPFTSKNSERRSLLDRAIIASVIAMAAMNVLVLSQQLQAEPTFVVAQGTSTAALA
jgi:hypothetical protein